MLFDITSANSKLRIVVPAYYPGGFDVDDYAADNMFETAALQNKEDMMSADGKYHAGFIFNPTEFTINLMATSNASSLIDDWMAAERTAVSAFACNAVLTVPALSAKWNFVNGVLYTWTPTPPGHRVLQPRPAVFHFESVDTERYLMARKEISHIVENEGRDKGKEFIITEMSAWDAETFAQDIFRAMGEANFTGIPADVISMGCAGLATVGLSVLSASSPEIARNLRDRMMSTVEIVIEHEGRQQRRKVKGSLDFEEVPTIRAVAG